LAGFFTQKITGDKMSNMQIAQTIQSQLGGRRFSVMTGAKNYVGGDNYLSFKVSSRMCRNKATHVKITLDQTDTYTVAFLACRGTSIRQISEHNFIYGEQLQTVFSSETGMATSL